MIREMLYVCFGESTMPLPHKNFYIFNQEFRRIFCTSGLSNAPNEAKQINSSDGSRIFFFFVSFWVETKQILIKYILNLYLMR